MSAGFFVVHMLIPFQNAFALYTYVMLKDTFMGSSLMNAPYLMEKAVRPFRFRTCNLSASDTGFLFGRSLKVICFANNYQPKTV